MSDRRLDPEQVVRDWLAGSAPHRAPASLKAAVEEVTSRPTGHARPWPRAGWRSFRFAGRVAAAVAILAVAGTGAYFYGNFRATAPVGPSEGPSATATATSPSSSAIAASPTASPSPSPSIAPLQPVITKLPGSNWSLLSGAFPEMVKPMWSQYQRTVFALASGGFVAFLPSAGNGASQPFGTATTWETRVYQSANGIDWVQRASLPGATDTVTAAAQSGGTIVAVGSTGETPNMTAMAWTTSDLLTWDSTALPAPAGAGAYSTALAVAGGPDGFLACGETEFSTSPDGLSWTPLVTSGAPGFFSWIDGLYAVPDGWVIRGELPDRWAMWHSADGGTWTQAWTGPAPQGLEFYALGPILKAAGGGYVSFGVAGMEPGGQPEKPYDTLIWTSKDLLRWTVSERVATPGWIADYAAGPGGYVAAGVLAPGDPMILPTGSVAVWTSKDGHAWKAIAGLESIGSSQVVAVVGDGAHVLAVCVDGTGNVQLVVGDGTA
jgi:hypothetical protein